MRSNLLFQWARFTRTSGILGDVPPNGGWEKLFQCVGLLQECPVVPWREASDTAIQKKQHTYTWKWPKESANASLIPVSLPWKKMGQDYFTIPALLCLLGNFVSICNGTLQKFLSIHACSLEAPKKSVLNITQPPPQTLNQSQLEWGTILCTLNHSHKGLMNALSWGPIP